MKDIEFSGFGFNLFGSGDLQISPIAIFVAGGILILVMLIYYFRQKRFKSATIKYSDVKIVSRAARSSRQKFRFVLIAFRLLAIAFLVLAFARPRSGTEIRDITSEGIDIMIVLDVSSSMQAEDFKPNNRLFVAKQEIKNFINKRVNDRIGLVVFARNSFAQCPLTVDYGVLLEFVDQVNFGLLEDGTAIGMGIANGVNRLRESESKSRIIVLLTDGDNNAGEIDPITAANLAAAFDIKIYTIGAGKKGNAMFPYQDPIFGKRYIYQPTTIDEETLTKIAEVTGGKYFRAQSGKELEEIYSIIDNLEKTEIKVSHHIQYSELFPYFTYAGLLLLVLEALLGYTYFRKLP
ncbi:MAG: VWA domain-containing protein [candidate division Zixibacteria bacterium]|nr:VWA domain-containing protein [candidate division Zixibacteria bacterium]